MSVHLYTDRAELRGDGMGANGMYKSLRPAPSTAKKMRLAFRQYFDSITASKDYSSEMWNHCRLRGLHFDVPASLEDIPSYANDLAYPTEFLPDRFFGLVTSQPYGLRASPFTYYHNNWALRHNAFDAYLDGSSGATESITCDLYASGAAANPRFSFMLGNGSRYGNTSYDPFGSTFGSLTEVNTQGMCARNPTGGAAWSNLWEVWRHAETKAMYCRFGFFNGHLTLEEQINASWDDAMLKSPVVTIHGDVTSVWVDANGDVTFPDVLMLREGLSEQSLFFTYARQFYDLANNPL